MTRFIPREKLGKKARKLLDARQRRTWTVCPATKTIESKKHYNRKRMERGVGSFVSQNTFFTSSE